MANNLQKVHGSVQPVFSIDTRNGAIDPATAASGITTNFIGPSMDFFGIDLGADPSGQMATNGAVEAVLRTIGQLGTVMIYSVDATANPTNLSVGVYPVGAWEAATAVTGANLTAALQALGTVNTYSLAGATVTNVGFRLASTGTSAA